MLIQFFSRHQKVVALSFLLVMYAQFALPVHAQARGWDGNTAMNYRSYLPGTSVSTKSENVWQPAIAPVEAAMNAVKTFAPQRMHHSAAAFGGGPTQPEMQSFQSVNSNNMVDLFTGDFSYNIPLMDVGGYPINIHYSSGITMDQDASWVGLGWNINPGTITRNMRGLPDDFNGTDKVEKTLNLKKNKTIGVTGGVNMELIGRSLSLFASVGVLHNTYKGWGTETGINVGINAGLGSSGNMTLGLGVTNNSQNGLDVSPSFSFKTSNENDKTIGNGTIGTNYNSRSGINSLQMSGQLSVQHTSNENVRKNYQYAAFNTAISFSKPSFTPSVTIPFTSSQFGFKLKLGSEAATLFPNGFISGYSSEQSIDPKDQTKSMAAYGYLYYQDAKGDPDALLDFNREKEMAFREKEPHIAVPMYTYDSYTINGEGIGGMFRPYRGDIGFVYDHAMTTKSNSNNFSLDLGFGAYFHGGVDYNGIFANTKNSAWLGDNLIKDAIPFKQADSTYEPVYFKNPGEKTSVDQNFYDAIGDTKLARVDLSPLNSQDAPTVTATQNLSLFQNAISTGKISLPNNSVYRKQRDKRTQVISYLNATAATQFGLDKSIKSYYINQFPGSGCAGNYVEIPRVGNDNEDPSGAVHKAHHLSEISVLNNDGRRYVYGIPVYNVQQQDVTFAVDKKVNNVPAANLMTGQTEYIHGKDNSPNNTSGLDNYFNQEKVPSYAHSFLLSGILSPDYVDITGDGISEDDNGEAIKFNYSRVYGPGNSYKWRAPFDSAAYNEGLKTDSRDEKASYSYGEREVWYLNSVESKTMMATFVLDVLNERKDAHGVAGVNGGLDAAKKLYSLKEINLYSKADYLKNGPAKAKPIKTVHFDYSYELCKKNPSSLSDSGKLTLKKIWFSYNKNEKGQLNPYIFTYDSTKRDYLKGAVDRWGNYKDSRNNPGKLSNADYPYTLQPKQAGWDSAKAASDASAWNLSKIKLPSGGELRVTYESDDYAYVQNKRAMQMFTIAGFGPASTSTPSSNLYTGKTSLTDYSYVFIKITDPVYTKDEIRQKYLEGVNKIYFKLFVRMPADIWGKGGEFVPFYAQIEGSQYGIKGNPSDKMIWIKLASLDQGAPPAVAATQFLRLNLPSKAYPYSEPGDDVDAGDFIKMIATAAGNIREAVEGFGDAARAKNLCNYVSVDSSFVRLDNPCFKKLGGGLRVKRIEVFDNFRAMTKLQQSDATYGQEYDYSTIKMINNVPTRISSGVAAYEPAIGGEENPFHQPVEYSEQVAPMAPTNYRYTEEPLGETYFPGPMVGYSKVKVQTINKNQKSANGFEQTEFYTTYDFPTLWEFTPLDNESKKTYNPTIRNLFKFFARHDVTLSQGFKVELNDMNGKIKSQSSFSQNDPVNPISYTYNYYKVDNEASQQKHLQGGVAVMDSANGKVNLNGQMGKDVEIMVDLREQLSKTIMASDEANVDVVPAGPFAFPFLSLIPIPSSETNRYRSVAVMKVVNRYGILDSVVHIEKGSKVSTKNMVYDGETGEVVLSRTNNEFDDPVYNFVYPAHWAYSGMGPAYKNIGASWTNIQFRQGKMFNTGGVGSEFNTAKFFESGDELVVNTMDIRNPLETDTCSPAFYYYVGATSNKKIWAMEAAKGKEGHKGIYFIDKNGLPFSGTNAQVYVLRSGKKNMASTPVGSITSLVNPMQNISGTTKIVFDTSSRVIAASSAKFTDFWRVDSASYRKDTTIIVRRQADSVVGATYNVTDIYGIVRWHGATGTTFTPLTNDFIRTYSQDPGGSGADYYQKTWLKFDLTTSSFNPIPQNSVITAARIFLYNDSSMVSMDQHLNLRVSGGGSNQSYLRQTRGPWAADFPGKVDSFFNEVGIGASVTTTAAIIPATTPGYGVHRNDAVNVTNIVQGMVDDYYAAPSTVVNGMLMGLSNETGANNNLRSQIVYSRTGFANKENYFPQPNLQVSYCKPCALGGKPYWSATPVPGYYCDDLPKDTILCKPNIVDSAVNPYRWGILGNWRMTRAYTYYDKRLQNDPSVETNIRKDGEIAAFQPYWTFTNASMNASTDTSRWVWNSEMTLFNRKGYEIENKDPLNRYNGGQYGYNQHMPVAVGQNARNREMMFDGFEDYGYTTDTCIKCATPRFIDLTKGGGSLVDTISHSGKYSLRVGGSQSANTTIKIASNLPDSLVPALSARLDTTLRISTSVVSNGTGLAGKVYSSTDQVNPCTTLLGPVNYDWNEGSPSGACGNDYFNIVFTGKIQPKYTGRYYFQVAHDDYAEVFIDGVSVFRNYSQAKDVYTFEPSTVGVDFQAGKLYTITITYAEVVRSAFIKLKWYTNDGQQAPEIIPSTAFYDISATDASVASTIHHDTTYCVYARSPKPTRITLDRFSPLQGRQMVFSAWVKEEQACVSGNYQNDQVVLTFNGGSTTTITVKPKGKIIEGWQRIEEFITIPTDATSLTLSMQSTSGSIPVYFDDVRLHPFNSNIKSFVYDPVNLRLMAELDENNYATFYEYDDDGTLIRLKKETERGIKTIKETRSALQKL